MRLVLLGAPGAGKGTQAKLLKEHLQIPHISTGDIFRSNISEGTKLGKKVQKYVVSGELVPDKLTIQLVQDRLGKKDCEKGFLLDGFPRTIPQAEELDEILKEMGTELDYAVNIKVDDNRIVKRLSSRRICPECGRVHQLPPDTAEMKCDSCAAELIQRADDKEETVYERLRVYREQTLPLLEYYSAQGKLLEVDGSRSIDEVHAGVMEKLEGL